MAGAAQIGSSWAGGPPEVVLAPKAPGLSAAKRLRSRLDDQLRRLRDRHEEARHLRVRHRHWAALLDLAAEDRDHAPGRPEHVAEPHRDEARGHVPSGPVSLDDPFTDRLRLAVDRGR